MLGHTAQQLTTSNRTSDKVVTIVTLFYRDRKRCTRLCSRFTDRYIFSMHKNHKPVPVLSYHKIKQYRVSSRDNVVFRRDRK